MSLRRNAVYNVLGATLPIGVSLFTVPAYLGHIGEARFGMLSVAWLLLGYFGVFDLGLGMATAQQIAAREKDGRAIQAGIFWTALFTNLALGILGALIAWPIAHYYFAHVMKVSEALRVEMLSALPWLIIAVPLATVTGVPTGTLQGLHRFAALNIISVIGTIFFQLAPLGAAVFWSPSLTVVLPIAIAARVLTLILLWTECDRTILRGHPIQYHGSEVRVLLRFGLWVTVSVFFSPFLSMIDQFAIGGLIGAAAVTAYVVPYNLGDRLGILGNSAGSALFPRFSSLSKEQSTELAYNSERVLLAMMLVVVVIAIFLIAPFISAWIGPDFSRKASPAGEILMAGIWLDSLSRVPMVALRGQFRPEVGAKVDLVQLLPYWIALYVLVSRFGIEGAAAAYVFRSGLNYLLLARAMGTLGRMLPMLAAAAFLILLSVAGARMLTPLSAGWNIALLCAIGFAVSLAWTFLPQSERARLSNRARRSLAPSRGR